MAVFPGCVASACPRRLPLYVESFDHMTDQQQFRYLLPASRHNVVERVKVVVVVLSVKIQDKLSAFLRKIELVN
jgi:hypothetical protein